MMPYIYNTKENNSVKEYVSCGTFSGDLEKATQAIQDFWNTNDVEYNFYSKTLFIKEVEHVVEDLNITTLLHLFNLKIEDFAKPAIDLSTASDLEFTKFCDEYKDVAEKYEAQRNLVTKCYEDKPDIWEEEGWNLVYQEVDKRDSLSNKKEFLKHYIYMFGDYRMKLDFNTPNYWQSSVRSTTLYNIDMVIEGKPALQLPSKPVYDDEDDSSCSSTSSSACNIDGVIEGKPTLPLPAPLKPVYDDEDDSSCSSTSFANSFDSAPAFATVPVKNKPSRFFIDIEHILRDFEDKIKTMGTHHPKAKIKAQELLNSLRSSANAIPLNFSQQDLNTFIDNSRKQIQDAIPELQRDLSWGSYLKNMFSEMVNAIKKNFACCGTPSFWAIKVSDAAQDAIKLDNRMSGLTA